MAFTRCSLPVNRRRRRPEKCPLTERSKCALWKSQYQDIQGIKLPNMGVKIKSL